MTIQLAPTDDDLQVIAEQVWSSFLDPEGVSPLIPLPPATAKYEVCASVSMTGAWQGHLVIRCSMTAAHSAAAALLGMAADEITAEDVTDALGELANIIGGNVKSLLPEPTGLSLPHVLINGDSGWPQVIQICQLSGMWLDEPVMISVLESASRRAA